MCGIIGIIGKETSNITPNTFQAMLSSLKRRGPDEQASVSLNNCLLGQTRLSIVDVASGHQPMRDNTLPLTIVFNGEIYGYRELKKQLEKAGCVFSTHSDTEVILKAYSMYGKQCLKHLDGMFAFAIYDERTNELFAARDRFGKKPFYYSTINDSVFFASEIKALFASDRIRGTIDTAAIRDYLRLMYVPPHTTIYSNIKTLPPAHAMTIKDGIVTQWQYWELTHKPLKISPEEARQKFKHLFEKSVEKRMVADVEIGSFLSGGVDSTLVTLSAQKYTQKPIKTFAVAYTDGFNESVFAKTASQKIGTDHTELPIKGITLSKLETVMAYLDEPHADSSNVPQYEVSALAASKVKVAMSGDGADEIFMGYGWYQKFWHTPRWRWERWLLNPFTLYKRTTSVFSPDEITALTGKAPQESEFERRVIAKFKDPIQKINATDLLFYLPGQLLSKVDRTSMMNSLEVRCPFLDTELVEFVFNLPTDYKVSRDQSKILLKEILAEYFPKDFVYRRKRGFGAPIDEWLKRPDTRKYVENKLNPTSNTSRILSSSEIQKTLVGYFEKNHPWHYKVWSLLCLELWLESHKQFHS